MQSHIKPHKYLLAQEEFGRHTGVGEVDAGRESVQLGTNTLLLGHLAELIFRNK